MPPPKWYQSRLRSGSIRSIRFPAGVIAHPLNIPVTGFYNSSGNTIQAGIHRFSGSGIERVTPLVNFGMTIGKGEACRAIMVGGRLVNPGGGMRVEESRIIDAARMLIQKDPRVARPCVGEFTRLLDVLVKGI